MYLLPGYNAMNLLPGYNSMNLLPWYNAMNLFHSGVTISVDMNQSIGLLFSVPLGLFFVDLRMADGIVVWLV